MGTFDPWTQDRPPIAPSPGTRIQELDQLTSGLGVGIRGWIGCTVQGMCLGY